MNNLVLLKCQPNRIIFILLFCKEENVPRFILFLFLSLASGSRVAGDLPNLDSPQLNLTKLNTIGWILMSRYEDMFVQTMARLEKAVKNVRPNCPIS